MHITCINPRVIYHPHSRHLLSKYHYYVTPQGTFHSSVCHLKTKDISHDSIDNYKIINPATGETFPLFLVVRCNKCNLCAKHRTSQWSYRCICETRTSTSIPYFLTLTYNDKHLPEHGLQKRDIQLFLKRLRRNIQRILGKTIKLRYICCGEYGKNTHRAHYHLILWNIPSEIAPNLKALLKFIERNWSIATGKYNKNGEPIVEPLGFAYCLPLTKGGIEYVLKYMLKPSKNVDDGKTEQFTTYSQGIGRDYIKHTTCISDTSRSPLYLVPNSKELIEETCFDITRCRPVTRFLTDYTKNFHYPSESRLLTPFFRKYYKLALSAFNYAKKMYDSLPPRDFNQPFRLPQNFIQVTKTLNSFHLYDSNYFDKEHQPHENFFLFNPYLIPTAAWSRYEQIYKLGIQYVQNMMLEFDSTAQLRNIKRLNAVNKRQTALRARLAQLPPLNLEVLSDKQNKIIQNYERKEIF